MKPFSRKWREMPECPRDDILNLTRKDVRGFSLFDNIVKYRCSDIAPVYSPKNKYLIVNEIYIEEWNSLDRKTKAIVWVQIARNRLVGNIDKASPEDVTNMLFRCSSGHKSVLQCITNICASDAVIMRIIDLLEIEDLDPTTINRLFRGRKNILLYASHLLVHKNLQEAFLFYLFVSKKHPIDKYINIIYTYIRLGLHPLDENFYIRLLEYCHDRNTYEPIKALHIIIGSRDTEMMLTKWFTRYESYYGHIEGAVYNHKKIIIKKTVSNMFLKLKLLSKNWCNSF